MIQISCEFVQLALIINGNCSVYCSISNNTLLVRSPYTRGCQAQRLIPLHIPESLYVRAAFLHCRHIIVLLSQVVIPNALPLDLGKHLGLAHLGEVGVVRLGEGVQVGELGRVQVVVLLVLGGFIGGSVVLRALTTSVFFLFVIIIITLLLDTISVVDVFAFRFVLVASVHIIIIRSCTLQGFILMLTPFSGIYLSICLPSKSVSNNILTSYLLGFCNYFISTTISVSILVTGIIIAMCIVIGGGCEVILVYVHGVSECAVLSPTCILVSGVCITDDSL